jgi:hypothetical protein
VVSGVATSPDQRRISLSLDQSSLGKTTRPSRTVWLFGRVSRFRSLEPIKRGATTSEPHSRFTSRDCQALQALASSYPSSCRHRHVHAFALSERSRARPRSPSVPVPNSSIDVVDRVSGPAGFGLENESLRTQTRNPRDCHAYPRGGSPSCICALSGAASHRELQVARRRRTLH